MFDAIPGSAWLKKFGAQCQGVSPFAGDINPVQVPLVAPFSGRPCTFAFPHPFNYKRPIDLMRSYYWGAHPGQGSGQFSRYLYTPGMPSPVLITCDMGLLKAITHDTGDKEGQFNRSTLPTDGIARGTGEDTLLYANGKKWRDQKKLAAPPFGKTTLFKPDAFHEFQATFHGTAVERLQALDTHLAGRHSAQIHLEPEIKAVMLEMLSNNFFGCNLPYGQIREHYVPAIEQVIDSIVTDTVMKRFGVPTAVTRAFQGVNRHYRAFNDLTDKVLAQRSKKTGLWKQFNSDAPDSALRSNIKVFLAGALEATTSFASWAIAHLARNLEAQELVYQEIKDIWDYTPENAAKAKYLGYVMEETLRLTPALYFLPRSASADTWVETDDGRRLWMPAGTTVLLDVWHSNRHEAQWGVERTGYSALDFAPLRWATLNPKLFMHFGFGNGPRVCPGKWLGLLEVELVVAAFVKLFRFRAVHKKLGVRAGVSTKPDDGVFIEVERRAA